MAKINPFDAPIPGQSLTDTPGNAPWENPPQMVDPDEIMQFIYDQIMRPRNLKEFAYTVKLGATMEEIAKTVLMSGFTEGKWSVDAALICYNAVIVMLGSVAKKLGLTFTTINDRPPGEAEIAFRKKSVFDKLSETTKMPETPMTGLMAPPQGMM